MQEESQALSKIQASEQFDKLFTVEANTDCFQCGKKTKQWAETKHAVFLCLTCAANYKEASKTVCVKSVGLDLWKEDEFTVLRAGGNKQFKAYLEGYGLAEAEPKVVLRSKAAEYYRRKLVATVTGKQIEAPPSIEEGNAPFVAQIPLTEMTTDQIVTEAKQKLIWVGQKTKYYSGKAFDKVHHKITSGELKQDAGKAASTIKQTAKSLWSFMATKIEQIQKPKQNQPVRQGQL